MKLMIRLYCLILVAASSALAFARPLAVPPLPETEFADCEVTTNFPLAVDAARLHALHLRLDLSAAATNALEVLIGCDADEDGQLSHEESAIGFGYDCGNWFVRRISDDDIQVESVSDRLPLKRELVIRARAFDSAWNRIRVIRRGDGTDGLSVSLTEEKKSFCIKVR